jgi:hypothetical protein
MGGMVGPFYYPKFASYYANNPMYWWNTVPRMIYRATVWRINRN